MPTKNNTGDKITSQFANFISSLDAKDAEGFLESFFTESEQIMLIKRLAIIMMLERSVPYLHIAKMLEVSSGTVSRIDDKRKAGKFDTFLDLFASEKQTRRFWKIINALVASNVHIYGAQNWKWIDNLDELNQ